MDETLTPLRVQKRGGWRTFPYIIGGVAGLQMASQGVSINLLVYLIQQFNVNNVDATQILSIFNGCTQISPMVGTIAGDALGYFPVISASIAACLLSMLLFVLTSAFASLSPPPCLLGECKAATGAQLSVLYSAILLLVVGTGGTRFNISTFGANQMDTPEEQASFFNWFGVAMYISLIIGMTGIVYIEDNMGWVFGFSLCAALCAVSLLAFHLGRRCYRSSKHRENPFLTLVRSLARRFGRKATCHYDGIEDGNGTTVSQTLLTCQSFIDGQSIGEEEEEEIQSSIIRLLPLMASIILMTLAINIQGSLITLQAMVMDRHLGPSFLIPPASTTTFTLAAVVVSIPLLEALVYKNWHITHLQRIGTSHVLVFVSFSITAIIERIRLESSDGRRMSVMWLVPPLVLVGLAEAFCFPAQLVFYYQEFPESLRSSSAGLCALMAGIGCYLSTTVVATVRRVTDWWQEDTDRSRLDNVYWLLATVVLLNFGYFLLCAVLYKSKGKTKI